MKQLAFLFVAFIVSCSAAPLPEKTHGSSAFNLGSLHGKMLEHPHYSLREFLAAMTQFQPTIILTEIRKEHPGPIEGSIDGGIEQSLVGAYAEFHNIPIQAVDWFDDDLLNEMANEDSYSNPDLEKKIAPLADDYTKVFSSGTFFEIQSEKTKEKVRALYDLREQAGLKTWRKRNDRICKNISDAVKNLKDQRILIIFGLDHKYYLDDCLKKLEIPSVPTQEIFSEKDLPNFRVPEVIKKIAVRNIETSKALLQKRIKDHSYKPDFEKRITPKVKAFDNWAAKIKSL